MNNRQMPAGPPSYELKQPESNEETDGSPLRQSNGRTVVDRQAFRRSESTDESSAASRRNNSLLVYAGRLAIGLLLFVLVSGSVSLSKLSLVALSNRLWNLHNLTSDQLEVWGCCKCRSQLANSCK